MDIGVLAIRATIENGQINAFGDLKLFNDGTEVIILARTDWNRIAGSDSTRHQLSEALKEIEKLKVISVEVIE